MNTRTEQAGNRLMAGIIAVLLVCWLVDAARGQQTTYNQKTGALRFAAIDDEGEPIGERIVGWVVSTDVSDWLDPQVCAICPDTVYGGQFVIGWYNRSIQLAFHPNGLANTGEWHEVGRIPNLVASNFPEAVDLNYRIDGFNALIVTSDGPGQQSSWAHNLTFIDSQPFGVPEPVAPWWLFLLAFTFRKRI